MDTILAWMDSYPEIAKYAAIIAGMIAFVGVIFALCGNALLQWLDRWARRRHDRQVVRAALVAELKFLVASYENREELMAKASDYFDVPTHTATEVYEKLLDKIGLLTVYQANKVLHAYLAAKHLPMNLLRNEKDNAVLLTMSQVHEGYVRVSRINVPQARLLHLERIDLFKAAIVALDGESSRQRT